MKRCQIILSILVSVLAINTHADSVKLRANAKICNQKAIAEINNLQTEWYSLYNQYNAKILAYKQGPSEFGFDPTLGSDSDSIAYQAYSSIGCYKGEYAPHDAGLTLALCASGVSYSPLSIGRESSIADKAFKKVQAIHSSITSVDTYNQVESLIKQMIVLEAKIADLSVVMDINRTNVQLQLQDALRVSKGSTIGNYEIEHATEILTAEVGDCQKSLPKFSRLYEFIMNSRNSNAVINSNHRKTSYSLH